MCVCVCVDVSFQVPQQYALPCVEGLRDVFLELLTYCLADFALHYCSAAVAEAGTVRQC